MNVKNASLLKQMSQRIRLQSKGPKMDIDSFIVLYMQV
jgi:hypothetical protein